MPEATVYIVDDNRQLLEALQQLFVTMRIPSKIFESGREFLDYWSGDNCGCLLLDMRMPGMSGIELQARLKNQPYLPVIFMSGHSNVEASVHAMKNGALEVLQKPFDHDRLIEVVRQALVLSLSLFESRQKQQAFTRRVDTLSRRERQVMEQMVVGATNKEIARSLNLSPRTVETHRAHVLHKLESSNLAELVENVISIR